MRSMITLPTWRTHTTCTHHHSGKCTWSTLFRHCNTLTRWGSYSSNYRRCLSSGTQYRKYRNCASTSGCRCCWCHSQCRSSRSWRCFYQASDNTREYVKPWGRGRNEERPLLIQETQDRTANRSKSPSRCDDFPNPQHLATR